MAEYREAGDPCVLQFKFYIFICHVKRNRRLRISRRGLALFISMVPTRVKKVAKA